MSKGISTLMCGVVLAFLAAPVVQGATISQFLFDAAPIDDDPSATTSYAAVNSVAGGEQPRMYKSGLLHENRQITAVGPFGQNTGVYAATTNGQLALKSPSALSITGTELTIEMWINPSTYDVNADPINVRGNILRLQKGASGKFQLKGFIWGNSGYQDGGFGTALIETNKWTHIALTYDGAAIRTYVNGALDKETPLVTTLTNDGGAFAIGAFGSGSNSFLGMIDEIRISSRALAASELGFHATLVPEPTGMVMGAVISGLLFVRRRRSR